jgi:hypothetical protein
MDVEGLECPLQLAAQIVMNVGKEKELVPVDVVEVCDVELG